MFSILFLFTLLILLACYGLYTLSRLFLRHFFPYKPNVTLYISLGITFCFFIAFAFGAAGVITQTRSQTFANEPAQTPVEPSAGSEIADAARQYSEAYTKGYTDAIDEYIGRILASASDQAPQSDEKTKSMDASDEPGEDLHASDDLPINPDAQDHTGDSDKDTPAPPAGTTVFYTKSGSVLHRNQNCSYLKNASEILSCDASEAPDRPYCSRCG